MADCPDVIDNINKAIAAIEEAYIGSQIDAMNNIANNLEDTIKTLPPATPSEKTQIMCAEFGKALNGFNALRNSCSFDPTGCLKQVLESGILDKNPILAGAALAAAVFVDAATGNFTPPFTVPPPSLEIGVTPITIPGANVDIPEVPASPPSDDCRDPISDLNEALQAAEETYFELHRKASEELTESIKKFTGGLNGLPTEIKAQAFCVGADAGFEAMAALSASCRIDVGDCIKQVLQSGVLGGNPILAGATAGAALFADATSGAFPTIS